MLAPRALNRQGAAPGAKRSATVGLACARRPAVWARCIGVETGGELRLEEVALERAEEVCGLGQASPAMREAVVVLVAGDDSGDGCFLTVSVTNDELQCDAQRRASPGSSGRGRIRVILFDFVDFPQHLPALLVEGDDIGDSLFITLIVTHDEL